MSDNFDIIVRVLVIYLGAFIVYFLPTLLAAFVFRRRQMGAIFILNLTLGWTVLGWIGALVWAFAEDKAGSQ